MSTTLRIDRVHGRYRLRPPGLERERLDRALRDALEAPLGDALEAEGIGAGELLCIQRVHVPVRLDPSLADAALRAAWSAAIAAAIRAACDRGVAARYGSIAHALLDIVSSAALGRVERSWAWRQLELWPARDPHGSADLVAAAADALLCDPSAIVPVLVETARSPAVFAALASGLDEGRWGTLARAALVAAGAPTDTVDAPPEAGASAVWLANPESPAPEAALQPQADAVPTGGAIELSRRRLASEIARRSSIARAAAPLPLHPPTRHALAVLATLEVDGARLSVSGRGPSALVRVVATLLLPGASDAPAPVSPTAARREPPPVRRGPESPPEPPALRTGDASRAETDRAGLRDEGLPAPAPSREASAVASESARSPGRGTGARDAESTDRARAADEGRGPDLREVRSEGATQSAGLPFLLGLAVDTGLDGALGGDARLDGRSLRWVLHQLAVHFAAIDPADPAALAFCGLRPGDTPPAEGADPATLEERAAVGEAAERLTVALVERLSWAEEPGEAIRFVVDRPGRVVADPGWIEVHLPLATVSLELRRAGLDRDPDFIPWLGVVMRFVYE